jgi:hypothetical protein
MAVLETNITRSRKTYNVYSDEQKALFLYLSTGQHQSPDLNPVENNERAA